MSAGGLIAQAVLGGTHGAATGIGERLREEAKLKRQKALSDHKLENTKEASTHQSGLNVKEANHGAELTEQRDERKHGYTMSEINTRNSNARNNNWAVEVGSDGSLYRVNPTLGESQKIVGSDGMFGEQSGSILGGNLSEDDWSRLKYMHKTKSDRAKELRERNQEGVNPLSEGEVKELSKLNEELSALEQTIFPTGGGSTLQQLLNGQGGGQPMPDDGGQQPQDQGQNGASGFGGLLRQAQQVDKQQSKQDEMAGLEEEAEMALDLLSARPRANEGSRPYAVKSDKPTAQSIENAKQVRDKLMNLPPEQFNLLSDRQKANITGIIRDINQQLGEL